jgi:hypothetical protein
MMTTMGAMMAALSSEEVSSSAGLLIGTSVTFEVWSERIENIPYMHCYSYYTRKNAKVVTNLQQTCSNAILTTCQQDVFALLVPSLLTTCYKVVEPNKLVTSCSNNLLSSCNLSASSE